MPTNIITFEQALQHAKASQKTISILIGNGFSMAYDSNRFSFTNLFESAREQGYIEKGSKLEQLFIKLNTYDFEKVIRSLENGCMVGGIYHESDNTEIEKDIKALKKHLVRTVLNNHPEKATSISAKQSKKCSNFLLNFNKIYSLNYDLLTYWVIMQQGLSFPDGFCDADTSHDHVEYNSNAFGKDKLLFVHGALHIFDHKTDIIKLTFKRTGNILRNQIYKNLLNNIFPVFISEGTSEAKLEKIHHNYYLSHCYKSLQTTSGCLFLFGTVLKSNDEHIRRAITKGKFNNLYIGVFSDEDKQLGLGLKNEFEESSTEKCRKTALLYDLRGINPWK